MATACNFRIWKVVKITIILMIAIILIGIVCFFTCHWPKEIGKDWGIEIKESEERMIMIIDMFWAQWNMYEELRERKRNKKIPKRVGGFTLFRGISFLHNCFAKEMWFRNWSCSICTYVQVQKKLSIGCKHGKVDNSWSLLRFKWKWSKTIY